MTRLAVADGIRYAVSEHGRGSSLVLLHGFTGSRASWAALLPELARDHRVLTIDLLGHGDSDSPAAARHDVERQALDVGHLLERLRATPADVLGYSFGARVALRLAIDSPSSVRRLILESPSAGIADPAARATRRIADQRRVDQLARGDMAAFVHDWAAQPIFASQERLPDGTRLGLDAERRCNRPDGLAASLLGAGQGVMPPLHGRLGTITAPTLIISGRLDPRGAERAEEVARGIPAARHVIIEDAGHTPHLEVQERFLDLVLSALATPIVTPIPTPAT